MVTKLLSTVPPPDLKNDAHRAVGLHFKFFDKQPELAWDNKNRRWLERSAVETKVAIYEDRVRGWFLDCAARLQADHNAGFVVLMVAVSYLEGNEQYRRGSTSKRKSEAYFVAALLRVCPQLDEKQAARFYKDVRCGLFHDGMTKRGIGIENRLPQALQVDEAGRLLVSPNKLLDAVVSDFASYVDQLLDASNQKLRENFLAVWD